MYINGYYEQGTIEVIEEVVGRSKENGGRRVHI